MIETMFGKQYELTFNGLSFMWLPVEMKAQVNEVPDNKQYGTSGIGNYFGNSGIGSLGLGMLI